METIVKEVNVPMQLSEIKDYLENENIKYIVNYKKSELKDAIFLTYLSNLDIPADINMEGTSYLDKETLLVKYMTTRMNYYSESVLLNIASILLEYRNINTSNIISNTWFKPEERTEFIKKNEEMLKKWESFLESSILFAYKSTMEESEVEAFKSDYKIIEDKDIVGSNIVYLYSIPTFFELFLSVGIKNELNYYQAQFEEYMFKGQNFYHYFSTEDNFVLGLLLGHMNGDLSLKDIQDAEIEISNYK